jgi:hypothetical protein
LETRKEHGYVWTLVLYFSTVPKLIQAPVIMYNEIFQALFVEADILLLMAFLDLSFDCVARWKSLASEMFSQFSKHMKDRVFCYCMIILGHILLTSPSCWRPGGGNVFPTHSTAST